MMSNLLGSFVAEIEPAEHQQGRHETRKEFAQDKGCRHDNQLVEKGAPGHGPDHGKSRRALNPTDLLGIKGEIILADPALFFRRNLRIQRDIVEQRGDVIQQSEQAGGCHGDYSSPNQTP